MHESIWWKSAGYEPIPTLSLKGSPVTYSSVLLIMSENFKRNPSKPIDLLVSLIYGSFERPVFVSYIS